jgi:hypothetical protein
MPLPVRRIILSGTVAGTIAATVIAASPAVAVPPAPTASATLTRVTSFGTDVTDAKNKWIAQSYDCTDDNAPFTDPSQALVRGPGTPTLGAGSLVMTTGQYQAETELFRTAQFDGAKVSAIQHISYSTYSASTKAADKALKQPAYLRLSINTDGDSTAAPNASLYYEPAINHSDLVADGVWQSWDGTSEKWSTDGSPDNVMTLQEFIAANPDAVISNPANGGGVAFIAGCAGQNQTNGRFGVDRFAITTDSANSMFDFDPAVTSVVHRVSVTSTQGGWNAGAYDIDSGAATKPQQSMVFGPATAPSGIGSHLVHYGDNINIIELWRNTLLDGVNVGDIRKLSYATYQKPAAKATVHPQQPTYLKLSVSTDGEGPADDKLYFEPAFQHGGEIADNKWQTWNTADALWSTDGSPDNLTTLAAYSAAHPKATVAAPQEPAGRGKGGMTFIVGCPCDTQRNADFYVDNVRVDFFHGAQSDSDNTFDFEPVVPAPSISVPSTVVGPKVVSITGRAVAKSPVALYQRVYPARTYTKVATTTASANGSYAFRRTVTKWTAFYVRNYDRTNSVARAVSVRLAVALTLSTSHRKVLMGASISPAYRGLTVRFYRNNAKHTLLAKRVTGVHGRASARISWPAHQKLSVYAVVTPPAGNLGGQSAVHTIRVA